MKCFALVLLTSCAVAEIPPDKTLDLDCGIIWPYPLDGSEVTTPGFPIATDGHGLTWVWPTYVYKDDFGEWLEYPGWHDVFEPCIETRQSTGR